MTPEERSAVHNACVDAVRIAADLADVLSAISEAAKMARVALERVEVDMVTIAAMFDVGDEGDAP